MKIIKKIFRLFFEFPLYWISKFTPKNKNLEVIGSSLGNHFADNPKYFFLQHYKEKKSKVNLVWLTKNKKVVEQVNSIGLPVFYLYSAKGFFIALRASRSYISHQLDDINGALIGGSKIIQLWHGVPLKRIGFGGDWDDSGRLGKLKVLIFKLFPYNYYMCCDLVVAPSDKTKNIYKESFSKSFRNNKISENILKASQSRTLYFGDNLSMSVDFFPEIDNLLSIKNKYDKIISWLPTQRRQLNKSIIDVIEESKLDMKRIELFCKEKNFLFVIKAHFLDFDQLNKLTGNFNNILIYPHSDPYPLLKYTDILVTDYSSVFFDFLILKRPIMFMCHDYQEYSEKVKFYYDLKKLDIGNIYKNWDEIISNLESKDTFKEKRISLYERFNFIENYDLRNAIDNHLIK